MSQGRAVTGDCASPLEQLCITTGTAVIYRFQKKKKKKKIDPIKITPKTRVQSGPAPT